MRWNLNTKYKKYVCIHLNEMFAAQFRLYCFLFLYYFKRVLQFISIPGKCTRPTYLFKYDTSISDAKKKRSIGTSHVFLYKFNKDSLTFAQFNLFESEAKWKKKHPAATAFALKTGAKFSTRFLWATTRKKFWCEQRVPRKRTAAMQICWIYNVLGFFMMRPHVLNLFI